MLENVRVLMPDCVGESEESLSFLQILDVTALFLGSVLIYKMENSDPIIRRSL